MAAMITVDFQNCFIFILLCLFSLLCYSLFFRKPKDPRGCDLPPSPPSLPIIGHLHLLLSALTHKSLQKFSSKYGPLLHLRIFNVPIILVSSASVAEEIFRAHDVNISSRGATAIDESLVFGSFGFIYAPYGDYWRFTKKIMVTKLFRPQVLERSRGVRAEELQRFYGRILDKARKNENIEIGKEATMLINNILCRMSMGTSFSEENGEAERVRGLVAESYALAKKFFFASVLRRPLEKLGIPLFKKDIMGVSNRFNELLERILVEHKEKLDKEHKNTDMMDELLAAYGDENAEYKITRNHIKSLFVELFIGGTDSSVQTTQWTMAEIINNPNVLERLREEIDSVVGKSRLIQETDIPNRYTYLQAVVKEGLRLHPPGPLLVRRFQERCEIKGFYVPEKTTLVINAYAVMRDPDSWEDPDEFKPERFVSCSRSGEEDEKEQALKYLPFGGGRRGCPGVNLASIFVGTAIGVMVQCFDWKIKGDKVNMEETYEGMHLSMVHPLKCTPIPRIQPFSIVMVLFSNSSETCKKFAFFCSIHFFKDFHLQHLLKNKVCIYSPFHLCFFTHYIISTKASLYTEEHYRIWLFWLMIFDDYYEGCLVASLGYLNGESKD